LILLQDAAQLSARIKHPLVQVVYGLALTVTFRAVRAGVFVLSGVRPMLSYGRLKRVGLSAGRLFAGWMLPFVLLFAIAGQAEASRVNVRGSEMRGYARIILEFDTPPKTSTRATDSILVISFDQTVTINTEKLASELPSYVSVVRRDPDGKAIRLALIRGVRTNIMEAGERIFIDLMPDTWTGLPPGLPQEVVDELSRRARDAEAKVRDVVRRRLQEERRPLQYRVGILPTLTRVVFEPPLNVPVVFKRDGDSVELFFDAALSVEASKFRTELPPSVLSVAVDPANAALKLTFAMEPGTDIRGFREDETFILDIVGSTKDRNSPEAALPSTSRPAATKIVIPDSKVADKASADIKSIAVAAPAAQAVEAMRPAKPVDASQPPRPTGPLRPIIAKLGESLKIEFPFVQRTAAAAISRNGVVTVVFDTSESIEPLKQAALPSQVISGVDISRHNASTVIARFSLANDALSRLSPQGNGWALTIGDDGLTPTEPVTVTRIVDTNGRTIVSIPMTDVSAVHWLDDKETGERMAIATAFGPARGVSKLQRFVEFRVLPSAHGAAVIVDADDVAVRPSAEGVQVARDSGLTLSVARNLKADAANQVTPLNLAFDREIWGKLRSGVVRERVRELTDASADASRARKPQSRLALAQFLIANGFSSEGKGALEAMDIDDPDHTKDRTYLLWRALADIQANRNKDAAKWLAHQSLADDPEAVLWRAVLDARAGRWPAALAGFKRSPDVIEAYSDDLQAVLRAFAARAAVEVRDFSDAEREIEKLSQLPLGIMPKDEVQLLRARIDEVVGRPDAAIANFRQVMASSNRPLAAEAVLRGVRLALQENATTPAEAIAQYETLSVTWRGDDIEIRTLGQLGRLYAQNNRWREAFQISRRANEIFPNHEVSRALHDETAQRFEELFLTGKSDSLSRFDALALFYDFKEYTPVGRRGDEMIRRLTDRMVELDLFDQASDLLQHQVENRLAGAARATVAARLALLRLMSGKAAQALQTLQATRLPELPGEVKRARMLLEARALSDLSRTDLAVEMLDSETGPEVERLRADIFWQGRRWRDAGEAFERIVGERWRGRDPLSEKERLDVLRAAISYGLADEVLSLDRLRSKFAAKLSDSSDSATFSFLTLPTSSRTRQFRDIARTVASADTLAEFLDEYRKRYPEASTVARRKREAPAGDAAKPADASPSAGAEAGAASPAKSTPAQGAAAQGAAGQSAPGPGAAAGQAPAKQQTAQR
jgi:tetratricopeptide (TPR) repeat protein